MKCILYVKVTQKGISEFENYIIEYGQAFNFRGVVMRKDDVYYSYTTTMSGAGITKMKLASSVKFEVEKL